MNAWHREIAAWDAFTLHANTCPVCSHDKPMYPLCPEGQVLYRTWAQADAIAQRAEQEADEKADQLGDCSDEAPWIHADDWKPGYPE